VELRGFQLSVEGNPYLVWFCFAALYDWLRKISATYSTNQMEINRNLVARVFPRFVVIDKCNSHSAENYSSDNI